ncbi:type IV secretory system conjugative DNA transfer family protein [Neisseria wadsworthii]|nr:type IV secretory system conjugative DNA transfer family protein [Neisseria wadsworthii]
MELTVMMLYTYWQYVEELPKGMVWRLEVSSAVAALLPMVVLVLMLVALFSKPKRELHGSARFARRSEIKKMNLLKKKFDPKEAPDLLIGRYGKYYLKWSGKEFVYLAAPTRPGKGVGFVVPNCLHYRHSMVVYDPKQENFLITAGFRAKHGHAVYLFNPGGRMPEHERNPNAPLVSHRWNPLTYVRRNPIYTFKDAQGIATIMYPDPPNPNGSTMFFVESSRKLFSGLLMYLIETEGERDLSLPENKTTMANLFRLANPKNGKTLSEWIKDEIELRNRQEHTRLSDNCMTLLMDFANGNTKTGADIVATMTAPLSIFIDPVVEAATSDDDFFLDDVRKKLMTVYVGILPTETAVFSRLTNLFFSLLANVNVYQGLPENNPDILKYQCLMMMDEFTALGVVPAIEHGVAYMAGYNMRLAIIFQTPSQVEKLYQKAGMRTFFTNFGCQIVFPPREQADAEEYSKLIGYETFKAKSTSRSHGKSSSRSNSVSDQRRAVMNPDELKMMPKEDCIISLTNSRPIYAKKIIYWQDPVFSKRANLPPPAVPALSVVLHKRVPEQALKPDYVSPEDMASFNWQEAVNSEDIARSLLTALIPPDSKPEFVAELVPVLAKNWGDGSLELIAKILKDTSGISVGSGQPKAAA